MYLRMAKNPSNLTLSLAGIYRYDPGIFVDIVLPAEPAGFNKETLINTILEYAGMNEVRYPHPGVLKCAIDNFFRRRQYKYSELWKSMNFDYDPLLNYDISIHEERTISEENQRDETTDTTVTDNAERTVENNSSGNTTATESVSAFNSANYVPSNQTLSNGSSTSGGTENNESTQKTNGTVGTTENNIHKELYDRTESGDNSARSTMNNIRQQRDIVDFDIYAMIATEFEDAITIPVYTRESSNMFENGGRL